MTHVIRLVFVLLAMSVSPSNATEGTGYQVRVQPVTVQGCYAPGTPWEYVEHAARQSISELISTSLTQFSAQEGEDIDFIFSDSYRWYATATNGGGLQQGDPTTLTWSIVPDGTPIPGYNGEPASNSILRAELDKIYVNQTVWLPLFHQVFQRWSELTGIDYVYEPNDDGSAFAPGYPSVPGQLGVRGDVRIGGHPIDGNSGILAYNWYPDSGEMIIDVPDSFYNNTSGNSLGLRNMLAHEHGHGIGLEHTCPVNQTKLMEPFISFAFNGPQHDDVLDSNRGYGDPDEHNDQWADSTELGAAAEVTINGLSVDDDADPDYFSIQLGANSELSAALAPTGGTYPKGEQLSNGSCSAGSSFDSLSLQDLRLELLGTDGTTVLYTADDTEAGLAEAINNLAINAGAGTYYLRVEGNTLNVAQLYSLNVTVVPMDVCGENIVDLTGLEVNDGETFDCSANNVLILQDATVYTGGTLNVSAPVIELRRNVIIQEGAELKTSP